LTKERFLYICFNHIEVKNMGHQNYKDCRDAGSNENACGCEERRVPRLLQPFILLALKGKESYGYELIEKINGFGFHSSPPDVGSIYRQLRSMETERLVKSKWDTKGAGPAKRVYRITPQGEEILHGWAVTLQKRKESLEQFLDLYHNHYKKGVKRERR
jgi:poly-beta-hydroxybutyrate-responsive repressor